MNVHSHHPPDPRVAEILSAIRTIFVAKGFESASMQDLARAAGMSVGNFYRYFPSKNAIVEAMVAHDLAGIEETFALFMASDDPRAVLRQALADHIADERSDLWAEINATAFRKPEISALCTAMEDRIEALLVQGFARVSGLPEDTARSRFAGHARLVILTIKANILRQGSGPRPDVDALILRMLDAVLDEIFP